MVRNKTTKKDYVRSSIARAIDTSDSWFTFATFKDGIRHHSSTIISVGTEDESYLVGLNIDGNNFKVFPISGPAQLTTETNIIDSLRFCYNTADGEDGEALIQFNAKLTTGSASSFLFAEIVTQSVNDPATGAGFYLTDDIVQADSPGYTDYVTANTVTQENLSVDFLEAASAGLLTTNHKSYSYAESASGLSVSTTPTDITVARLSDGNLDRFCATVIVSCFGRYFLAFDVSLDRNKAHPMIKPRFASQTDNNIFEPYILSNAAVGSSKGVKVGLRVTWNNSASVDFSVYVINSFTAENSQVSLEAVAPTTTATGNLPDGSSGTKLLQHNIKDTVIDQFMLSSNKEIIYGSQLSADVDYSSSGVWVTIAEQEVGTGGRFNFEVHYSAELGSENGSFEVAGTISGATQRVEFFAGSSSAVDNGYIGKVRIVSSDTSTERGAKLQFLHKSLSTSGTSKLSISLRSMGVYSGEKWVPVVPTTTDNDKLPDGSSISTAGQATADWWRFGRGKTPLGVSFSVNNIFTSAGTFFSGISTENSFDAYLFEIVTDTDFNHDIICQAPSDNNKESRQYYLDAAGNSIIVEIYGSSVGSNDYRLGNNFATTVNVIEVYGLKY